MFNNSFYLKKSYDKKSSDKGCQFNFFNTSNDIDTKNKLIMKECFKDIFKNKHDIKNDKKSWIENKAIYNQYADNNIFKNNILDSENINKYTNKEQLISSFEKDENFVKTDTLCDTSVIYNISNKNDLHETNNKK
jgi:hypothetical protein